MEIYYGFYNTFFSYTNFYILWNLITFMVFNEQYKL